jgi:3-methyladenine DNA glycosylase AlkD
LKAALIVNRLRALGNPERAIELKRYFKTGPGEYAHGDVFAGLRVPQIRTLAKEYQGLAPAEIEALLHSPIHEARLLALLIMVQAYRHGDENERAWIYRLYRENTCHINNWDLVDLSAPQIVGAYLEHRDRAPLSTLAGSDLVWERRIAIMATFHFIKALEFVETLHIAECLLQDPHDLIHKAVGWMLREIGKRDRPTEEAFLKKHYKAMPRTMLRYAIEKFPESLRQQYLHGTPPA